EKQPQLQPALLFGFALVRRSRLLTFCGSLFRVATERLENFWSKQPTRFRRLLELFQDLAEFLVVASNLHRSFDRPTNDVVPNLLGRRGVDLVIGIPCFFVIFEIGIPDDLLSLKSFDPRPSCRWQILRENLSGFLGQSRGILPTRASRTREWPASNVGI